MGKVMHARRNPVDHRWVFPFYFYALDLDELPELNRRVRGFGFNHWQPVCLREQDYLRGSGPFREQLAEFIDLADIDRIMLVTVARFMARVFNPVSFYYCLRADGSPACMVAEVNNTSSSFMCRPSTTWTDIMSFRFLNRETISILKSG